MQKKSTYTKLKKMILIFLIIPGLAISLTSGKEKVKPADLLPDSEKGYIYGKFNCFGGDAFSYLGPRDVPVPDLWIFNMDKRGYDSLFFVQDKEKKNLAYYLKPLTPGMYILSTNYKKGNLPEPLNEEFEVEAGKIYYVGNYFRSYKVIPLVGVLVSGIQVCNHYSETTRIIKKRFPHFANLPIGSSYTGEPECTDPHIEKDLLKNVIKPQKK